MKRLNLTILACLWLYSFSFAQPAPDFTITATDGLSHSLYADYLNNGQTVVIEIFFVACPPCIAHAPFLEDLYQDWGAGTGDVEFLALSNRSFDSNADVAQYEQTQGLSYHGAGQDGGALTALQPYLGGQYGPFFGTPTFIVIAPDGTVNFDVVGGGVQGNIMALDAAIAATGALRPGQIVNHTLEGHVGLNGGNAISGVSIFLNDSPTPFMTTGDGDYSFIDIVAGTDVSIRPEKDYNDDNGITTFDLVLIQKHILNIDTLDTPYKIIAADVNRSNSVTTFDVVLLRKLILQIDTAFQQNTSWRFIPSSFTFNDPVNPFAAPFPEEITINNLSQNQSALDFVGLKVGDANRTANVLAFNDVEDRSALPKLSLSTAEQVLEAGQEYLVEIKADRFEDIIALQSTLRFDQERLSFVEIVHEASPASLKIGEDHFNTRGQHDGWLSMSWNGLKGQSLATGETVIALRFRALQSALLSEVLELNSDRTVAMAFTSSGQPKLPQLNFTSSPALSTLHLFPNPSNADAFTIQHYIHQPTQVALSIYKVDGKHVTTYQYGAQKAGLFKKMISAKDLPSGVYQVILMAKGQPNVSKSLVRIP